MSIEAKLNFFHVEKCGYYKRGAVNSEFGDLNWMLGELRSWAFSGDKPLSETCTYEIRDGDQFLHTYCFEISQMHPDDLILTTWNETESLDGGMATVNGKEPAGQAHVDNTPISDGHIPGYPTYFWLIPSENVFATLRFDQRLNGHSGLKRLLGEFLQKCTSNVVFGESEGEDESKVIGYKNKDRKAVQNLYAHFRTQSARVLAPIEYIRENVTEIQKIYRKCELKGSSADDRGLWERIVNNLGIVETPPLSKEGHKLRAEFQYTPSESELDLMIEEWKDAPDSKWNDVGFQINGEIKWLSSALIKTEISLDVQREENGMISTESIAKALQPHRSNLIGLVKQ